MALFITGEGARIKIHGVSSYFTGYAGVELYAGNRLITGEKPVSIAFCPEKVILEVKPGRVLELTIDRALPETAIAIRTPLPTCELPLMEPKPRATTLDDAESRVIRSSSFTEQNLIAAVSNAAISERQGDIAQALAQYRRIRENWPHAEWTAECIDRLVRDNLTHSATSMPPLTPRVGDPAAIPAKRRESGPSLAGGKAFAFLIGISQYKKGNGIEPLNYADKDAESFRDFLASERGGQLDKDQISLLRNDEATRDRIDKELSEFVKGKGGKNNTLILFIAAHGRYICLNKARGAKEDLPCGPGSPDEQPFILTYDTKPEDPNFSAYPMREFYRLITQKAEDFGRVLVYVDICHAGTVGNLPDSTLLSPAKVEDIFSNSKADLGVMLASARQKPERRDDEYAYESKDFGGGHGVFTYFVLEGLNGKVQPSDGQRVLFADLFSHVQSQVRLYTNNRQTPAQVGNAPNLVVLEDAARQGIQLGPVTARDASAQRRRGISRIDQNGQDTRTTERLIDPAVERVVVALRQPVSDFGPARELIAQIEADSANPEAPLRAGRLRVALEETGQSVILDYLKGEESPLKKEDFERCKTSFDLALRLAPDASFDRSRKLFCEGRALVFEKDYTTAVDRLERAIRLDPTRSYAYNALGIACLEQALKGVNYYECAVRAFDDAVRTAPYWAYPLHNLALSYIESGAYDAAINIYQRAIQLAPNYSYLPYSLALLYQRLNQRDEALAYYQTAIRAAELARAPQADGGPWPERSHAYNALGTLAESWGKHRPAEKWFRRALNDNPESLEAKHNLAMLLTRKRLSPEGEKLWRTNLAIDPGYVASRLALAEYLAKHNRTAEAIPQYQELLARNPDFTGARLELAELYLKSRQLGAALQELRLIASSDSYGSRILERLGDIEMLAGRADEAEAAYEAAVRRAEDRSAQKRIEAKRKSAAIPASRHHRPMIQ